jgi:hypothetical protein
MRDIAKGKTPSFSFDHYIHFSCFKRQQNLTRGFSILIEKHNFATKKKERILCTFLSCFILFFAFVCGRRHQINKNENEKEFSTESK